MREVRPKRGGVERVAQSDEGWEESERRVVQAIEVGKVPGLVDLVDVCLFGGEGDVGLDFVADGAEQ